MKNSYRVVAVDTVSGTTYVGKQVSNRGETVRLKDYFLCETERNDVRDVEVNLGSVYYDLTESQWSADQSSTIVSIRKENIVATHNIRSKRTLERRFAEVYNRR